MLERGEFMKTKTKTNDRTVATLRRQLTCARKRIRRLEAERQAEVLLVARRARRYIRHNRDWNWRWLKRAVAVLDRAKK